MNLPHPKYQPTINFGQVLTMLSILGSLGTFGLYIWYASSFQARTELRLAAGEAVRVQYIPIVNDVVQSLELTKASIADVKAALTEINKNNDKTVDQIILIRERLAALEAKQKAVEPFRP